MGIHESQFLDIAFAGDGIDGQPGSLTIFRRRADMEGIVTDGSALHSPRTTCRLTCKNYGGGGFSEIQSQTLDIEGTALALGNSLQRLKAGNGELALCVGSAYNGIVVVPGFEKPEGKHHGRHTRYAGIAHSEGNGGDAQPLCYMLCRRRRIEY